MPTYKARALALKKTKLGETDLIITLLSSDGTQLRAVAKGARKPGGRFGARTEPFTLLEGQFATGRTLDVMSDVHVLASHALLRETYPCLLAASVVVELLDKISAQSEASARFFDMTEKLFEVMETSEVIRCEQLLLAYLLKLLALLGYRPVLEDCAMCGRAIGDEEARFCWSAEAGGVICTDCGAGQFVALEQFPEAARRWLRMLLGTSFEEISRTDIEPSAGNDLFKLVVGFVSEHFPAQLKALDFYRSQRA